MNPTDLRATIPALEGLTYFNFGASGPSPRPVVEAAQQFLEEHEYESPGREGMYPKAFDTYDGVRETIGEFIGADPREIALTESTTDGINRFACALDLDPDAIVVRTDLEHPAGILPWQRLARTRGITVRVVESENGNLDLDGYKQAVTQADLVTFSALTWNYGTRLPVDRLTRIAHDAGALVLIDAVQWPGQAPIDVHAWDADAVAAAGHKWLLGPWGAGFLYVDEDVATQLVPGAIGYRGVQEPTAESYQLKPGAARFEIGTASPAPHVALDTSLSLIDEIGIQRIEERIARLAARLIDGIPTERLLSPTPPESGLITIDVDDPDLVVAALREQDIVIRSLPEPDAIRVSVHAVNTTREIDTLTAELERFF